MGSGNNRLIFITFTNLFLFFFFPSFFLLLLRLILAVDVPGRCELRHRASSYTFQALIKAFQYKRLNRTTLISFLSGYRVLKLHNLVELNNFETNSIRDMVPVDETCYIKEGQDKRQKIAIVGSGLAGLTTAYLLNRDNYDVEIFEIVS